MKKMMRQRGFTLVEILIVLSVLGVLAAIVVPNVAGYISRGKERAYNGDKSTIQAAVDAYYSDPDNVKFIGKRQYPIFGKAAATNLTGAACADDLVANVGENPDRGILGGAPVWVDDDADGIRDSTEKWDKATQLKGTTTYCYSTGNFVIDIQALVDGNFLQSVPKSASVDNKTALTGSYTWYVDATGKVESLYYHLPEATSTGFQTGTYP